MRTDRRSRGLGEALAGQPDVRLLERELELAAIEQLLTAAAAGDGAVLVIEGPPGIGKSALLASACTLAADGRLDVLRARGGELERDLPFSLVRELLSGRIGRATTGERRELLAGAARFAAPVLGPWIDDPAAATERAEPPRPLAGAESLSAALHGLFWLCSNLADRRPLLLAVDDAHWADPASRRFLAYLAHRIDGLPALLAVTTRTGEDGADLFRGGHTTSVLTPRPLTAHAVGEMLEDVYDDEVADEFARAVHEQAAGNPFLVRELAVAIRDEGLPPRAEHAERVRRIHSRSIAVAVVERLRRLPRPALELARAVAILGADVELRHAATVAELSHREADAAADALAAADILEPGRPLALRHPIIRSAIYADVPPATRATGHARAARALADEGATSETIAAHLLHAERLSTPWVVDVLRDAASSAMRRGAPEAAGVYLRRALAEPPAVSQRPAVLNELGSAEFVLRDPAAIDHFAAAAAAADDRPARARARLNLGHALFFFGRPDDAVPVLEQAVDDADGVDAELRLRLEALLISAATATTRPVADLDRHRRRLGDLRGETPGERVALAAACWDAMLRNEPRQRVLELAERALADGRLLAETTADAPVIVLASSALKHAGELGAARSVLDAAVEDARQRGSTTGFEAAHVFRSHVHMQMGALRDAEADLHTAMEAAPSRWVGDVIGRACHAKVLVEQGRLDEADAVLADFPPLEDVFRTVPGTTIVLDARVSLHLARGRYREALEESLEAGRLNVAAAYVNPALAPWRSYAALAHLRAGQRTAALELTADEVRLARAFGAPRALGIALRTRALVEGGERALELLSESVRVLGGSEARLEHARSLVELGAALRRRNRRGEARAWLERGMDLAARCGAMTVAERARAELNALGARPRRVVVTGIDALTASERRVAEMAADGLSNSQIAQALFVTRKTVEKHLGNAYTKLDIGSRDELPAELAQRTEVHGG